jgi:hypothetical protein
MLISSVRLFFVCAHGEVDTSSEKTTLIDPVFELTLPEHPEFPFVVGSMYAYANLSGGLGVFRIHIEISDEQGRLITKTKPVPVEQSVSNRRAGSEFLFEMPEFRIENAGVYTVGLYQNYKCIAATDVSILNLGD